MIGAKHTRGTSASANDGTRSIADGATHVIGPLQKTAVNALAAMPSQQGGAVQVSMGRAASAILQEGAKIAENATLEEWKERPSQFEVPRDQLVAKVQEILDGQVG